MLHRVLRFGEKDGTASWVEFRIHLLDVLQLGRGKLGSPSRVASWDTNSLCPGGLPGMRYALWWSVLCMVLNSEMSRGM
jgi:hypothetical protein